MIHAILNLRLLEHHNSDIRKNNGFVSEGYAQWQQ